MRRNRPFLRNQRPAKPKFESGWGDEGCEDQDVGFMSKEDFAVLFVALVFGPLGPSMAPCAQTESSLSYLHEQQRGPPSGLSSDGCVHLGAVGL